uniref:Putative heteroproteinous nuclear ribonucleoprotein r rrm superfamily n=1 Tax=Ixodes ricinus TaxID=34613 RepID=V5H892_IXORI
MALAQPPEAGQNPRQPVVPSGGPLSKEAEIVALLNRTGFPMIQDNGQRRYGPPPDWHGDPPQRGCEVFIGKLPRDFFEDELVPLLETVGPIYELRLMMDFAGSNRGYAFATYTNREDARRAVRELDEKEIRRGKRIGVCKSTDNCRLFVGGIPRTKTREDVLSEMSRVTEGVVNVILYTSVMDKTRNRGFAFVEYTDHKTAAVARRKMIPGKMKLWNGHDVAVDWAEPEPQVDEDTMSKVMVLYVRNLVLSTTEDELREVFSLNGSLKVSKVKKIRDFAFIHYRSREEATTALEAMQNAVLNGSVIEVTWSKPVDRSRNPKSMPKCRFSDVRRSYCGPPVMMASPSAPFGYDFYSLGSPRLPPIGTGRPVDSSRAPVHGRGRGAGGVRGYRPMPVRITPFYTRMMQPFLVDLQPGMQLTPTPQHVVFKPAFHAVQILLDVCHKNGWGEPQFQLHTVPVPGSESGSPDSSNAHNQLYLYKVTLPDLPAANNTFTPSKLCRSVEEAKDFAAEHVLGQLGIRPEMPQPDMAHLTSPLYVTAAPMGSAGYGPYGAFLPPAFPMYGGTRQPHYGYEAAY